MVSDLLAAPLLSVFCDGLLFFSILQSQLALSVAH
jgi:hypothetical protein